MAIDQSLRTDDRISGAVAWFNYRDDFDDDWLSQPGRCSSIQAASAPSQAAG